MREPTSSEAKWAWWEAAVAGLNPPRYEDEPQVGYYKVRRWPRLPYWLPAHIALVSPIDEETGELIAPEYHVAEIDGTRRNAIKVWTWLHPCTVEEYEWLTASRPLQPKRNPRSR